MDESDVVQELPLVRLGGSPLLEQRDGLVGAAGPAGRLLAEEDGAEAVCDGEVRIEGGGQIEERLQQLIASAAVAREAIAAVMLDRADPIHVGGDGAELERETAHGGAGTG